MLSHHFCAMCCHQLHVAAGRASRLSLHGQPPPLLLRLFTDFGKAIAPGRLWRSYCLGLFCCRLLCFGLFLERKGVQGTAAGALGPRGWSRAFCAPRLPFLLRRWQRRAHRDASPKLADPHFCYKSSSPSVSLVCRHVVLCVRSTRPRT